MGGYLRAVASWMPACALTAVAGSSACVSSLRGADPETLFAQAEELRLVFEKDASRQAISKYGDARAIWIRDKDPARAAMASRMVGATYDQLGLLEDALREYLEAMSLCRDACDALLKSAIQSDVGVTQAKLADGEESLEAALRECESALSLALRGGGLREEAEALNCAGEVEYHRGNLDEALELYRRAITPWKKAADPKGQAETMLYKGMVLSDLARPDEAKASLEDARALSASSKNKRAEAMALIALGRLGDRQGEYQSALNHFQSALELLEPTGDLLWEASALGGIGNVYFAMADGDQALYYFREGLKRVQRTGVPIATWDSLLAVGGGHLTLKDPSEALHRFEEALELAERMGSDRWQQISLYRMSQAHQALGQAEESLKCLERALQLTQSALDPKLEGQIRLELGNTYELLGSHAPADENFRRALVLSEASQDRVGEAMALFGMAGVARSGDNLDAAREYAERSLAVTESLRDEVASRELRTSYFASIHRIHELYMDVLMGLHQVRPGKGLDAAAFAASERARARSLLDSLTEARIDIRAGVDAGRLEREVSLKRSLDASIERRMRVEREDDEKEADRLDREVQELGAKWDLALAEIRSESPLHAALARHDPLVLAEVQKQLLDDDTVLLEYALGEKRSFLWAISKHEYSSFELSPQSDIENDAGRLYELLTARARVMGESLQERTRRLKSAENDYWQAATRLSRTLLGPVADRIKDKKIVVVADGALHYLPFGALPAPGSEDDASPMMVSHEIVNLPSASALAILRQQSVGRTRPKGSVAVFADPVFTEDDPRLDAQRRPPTRAGTTSGELGLPRLEGTKQEAAAILELAPEGTTLTAMDFDASRSAAVSGELAGYRIVHFATHGISNTNNPAVSGVVLSMFDERGQPQDGFLRLHDIYDLRLSADLVVLSACNTALGEQMRGEGIVGIVQAFMTARARSVVATLWTVDDEATRELMSRFYQGMFEAHQSPSAALRQAQRAMWSDPKWRSPFFWAAFVVQGEWREVS